MFVTGSGSNGDLDSTFFVRYLFARLLFVEFYLNLDLTVGVIHLVSKVKLRLVQLINDLVFIVYEVFFCRLRSLRCRIISLRFFKLGFNELHGS